MTTMTLPVDMMSVKTRLSESWSAGDYDRFSRYMEGDAYSFYDRLAIAPGAKVLDVACGSGQFALIAAREGMDVTGVDIAENSILRAEARARAEDLSARFRVADAEALPFEDGEFDVVVSLIGAMFAPQPDMVASELSRVCAPGGTLAMANWTPSGFVGKMFKSVAKFIAPLGVPSPVLWGDEDTVRQRLGGRVSSLHMSRRYYTFSYPFPPTEVVDFFRLYYGPTNRAFASLDLDGRRALHGELQSLWADHNTAQGDFTVVKGEYLEVIAIR